VRRAGSDRVAALARLAAQAFAGGWSTGSLAAELRRPDSLALVLEPADPAPAAAPQGFLLARRGVGELHLLLVAVAPGARRRGGGSALLAGAIEDARRAGLAAVHLEVRAGNEPALAFYRRHGFLAVGRRPRYYEGREDAILMTRSLAPETCG
jgi:ribosomal-protein-alanine N-acetyltransferase